MIVLIFITFILLVALTASLYGLLLIFHKGDLEPYFFAAGIAALAPAGSYLFRHILLIVGPVSSAVMLVCQLAAYPIAFWALKEYSGVRSGAAVAYCVALFFLENVFVLSLQTVFA